MKHVDPSVDGERRIALIDLLDRVLAGGVVITGDIKLSIADVDMVQISLRALISSVSTLSVTAIEPPVPRDALELPADD
ncbi:MULTISPECIES: gas vesicle protein [Rhodococcus]|uniref:Gas vesicle protein n=2 Tax=Rhodococcus TaxID=1827 RepID=A0A0M9WPV7_RHORH|nr:MULTISPECIES: gas vesicle protein [Rhodococcus]EME66548.1 putative gas vesicle protein [Rhodococcus ruber BKS 20-38]KOS57133.1 gas vesicle protein [Rhodococcus rhodochrous KG-21]RQM35398.1 gas vesicle protein [Rhodococcus ruber]